MDVGEILERRYEIVAAPQYGGMSLVACAKDLVTGAAVAVKMSRQDKHPALSALSHDSEVWVLERVRSRHIVGFHNQGVLGDRRRYLVIEWLPHGLDDKVEQEGRMSWDQFCDDVGKPLLEGLRTLHKRQIAHRDLSPKNIRFAADGTLRITDARSVRGDLKIKLLQHTPSFKSSSTQPERTM